MTLSVSAHTLAFGALHPDVLELQRALNAVHARRQQEGAPGLDGAPLTVDGRFGRATRAAVLSFQRHAFPGQLHEHDGAAGPRTWAALHAALAVTPETDGAQDEAGLQEPPQAGAVEAEPTETAPAAADAAEADAGEAAPTETADLSDAFFEGVRALAGRLQRGAPAVLADMMAASGLRPDALNRVTQASGLLGFAPDTLTGVGWPHGPAAFRALSAEAQLPYVEAFLSGSDSAVAVCSDPASACRGPRWQASLARLTGETEAARGAEGGSRPTLRRGAAGDAVRGAQLQLNAVHGQQLASGQPGLDAAPLEVDGQYGARTQRAVRAFQRLAFPGRPAEHDGVLGPRTWAALDAAGVPGALPAPVPRPSPAPRATPADWFLTDAEIRRARGGHARALQTLSTGNVARPLIDGAAMMAALKADIDACRAGDEVYLSAWQLHHDVVMLPGAASGTVLATLGGAVARGAQVRVLLWRNQLVLDRPDTPTSVRALERAGVQLILDARHPSAGSMHQKTAVIRRAGQGLVAYCGGIDLAHDRWDTRRHDGDPRRVRHAFAGWHDVHVRLEGPAAHDVALNFVERWNDRKWPSVVPPVRPPAPLPLPPPARPGSGRGAGAQNVCL